MNKSYKFKVHDIVVCGDEIGEVRAIYSLGGTIVNLRVELLDGKTIKIFKPELTQVVDFDQASPSNKYLESLLKGKQDKPAEPVKKAKTKALTIDELLDRYNDNKALYGQFKDESYKNAMDDTLKQLELASKGIPVMETINED